MSYVHHISFDLDSDNSSAITTGDFNEDGLEDLVIANFDQPNTLFINKEKGASWEKTQLSKKAFRTYDVLTADLNGDGALDIIESNSDEVNLFYLNKAAKRKE